MKEHILNIKSKSFALEIIHLCRQLKDQKVETALTNQLLRSGTSIGANIHEAQFAQGKADFVSKLQIALKECSETEYWLELLIESGSVVDDETVAHCIELKKMLVASINTSKAN